VFAVRRQVGFSALANMQWAADPSRYKAATSPLAKCSIGRVKHLAPTSSRMCPGIGCGTVGVEAGRVGAVLYRGGKGGEAGKTLKAKGIVQGGARPTVGKHGMERPEDPAPTRSQPRPLWSGPWRHPAIWSTERPPPEFRPSITRHASKPLACSPEILPALPNRDGKPLVAIV
jgi:hypothetical protein